MGVFLVRAVLNPIPSLNITYSLSVSAASCNEGDTSPQITITRNLNGLPDQGSSIRFRTLSAAEFATEFPAETQALAADFTEGYADTAASPLRAACTAAGISVVHIGGQYDKLVWVEGVSQNSVSFTRVAINNPAEQGDKRSAYIITDPLPGSIVTDEDIASFEIIDTYVAPPALSLVDPGLVYTLRRTTAVAGETVFWVEAATGTLASVALENDAGGKFAVGTPVAGRYPIITTSTAADFEGSADSTGYTVGTSHERVTVRATGTLAEVVDLSVDIWPEFDDLIVTGGDAYSATEYTTATNIQNSQNSSTSNKRVRYPTAGIYKFPSGNNLRRENGSNVTFEAVRGVVERCGRGTETQLGTNKLYRNRTIRAGAHAVTELGGSASNVDNFVIGQTTGTLSLIKFENCSFSLSWDELGSVINVAGLGPYVRGVWFDRCLFHSPLIDQRDGIAHHYGPIIAYEKTMQVAMTRCVIAGCAMRSPFIGKARGVLLQNNVIYYRSTNTNGHSGITIKAGNSLANDQDISIIIRGNLLKCEEGLTQATGRSMAIGAQALGTGSYINANFDNSPYENHFFQHASGTPLFADDPLILASHVMKQVGTLDAGLASFVDFDPFTWPQMDDIYMPTDSEANRLACWQNVKDYAGNRARTGDPYTGTLVAGASALDRFDYNLWSGPTPNLLTDGKRSGPTYAGVDTNYGTAWDGVGGTLGYAMNATPP